MIEAGKDLAGRTLSSTPWLISGRLPLLLDVLDRDGEEARVVGGAVRNALLGLPLGDFDIATTALPEEVVRRAKAAGFRTIPTGIEHGTVTVMVDGQSFEVTTLREDVETYGRKAKVAFGRDWVRDAQRRDFTINALSLSRSGQIHDYVGGLDDLSARRVRFIGDAKARIAEDYLRIMRFFRFHAQYGKGALDAEGAAACISGRDGLAALSRERIRTELLKLLIAPHAVPALVAMEEGGLLTSILGGVPLLASCSNMIKLEHALNIPADPVRRLASLGVVILEDAERLTGRLRLANAEHDRLVAVGASWRQLSAMSSGQGARAVLYALGKEQYLDCVLIAWSRASETDQDIRWRGIVALPARWSVPIFPITSGDAVSRGIAKGPDLGRVLRLAEAAWVAADFPVSSEELGAILDAAIASIATHQRLK